MKFVLLKPGHGQEIKVCVVKDHCNGLFTVVVVGGETHEIGTTVSHAPCPVVCLRIICSLHWPVYTSAPLCVLVNPLCARDSFVCS
jgi:hypothetical protein